MEQPNSSGGSNKNNNSASSTATDTIKHQTSSNNNRDAGVDSIEIELDQIPSHSKSVTFQYADEERSNTIHVDHHQSNAGVLRDMDDILKEKLLEDKIQLADVLDFSWEEFSQEARFNSEGMQTTFCVLTAVYYIVASYIQLDVDKLFLPLMILDLVLSILFIILFFVGLVFSKNKIKYFFQPLSILDYVTVLPTFIIVILVLSPLVVNENELYSIIGLFRVLRLLRLIPLIRKIGSRGDINSVVGKVLELGVLVACLLIIFTGIFQWLENFFGNRNINFHDSLYFVAITLFTIGYGDIAPTTVPSRFAVIIFFVIGITTIPIQISGIYDIVTSETSIFKAKNPNLKNHAIVTGICRVDEVVDFIKECFQYKNKNVNKIILVFKKEEFCKVLKESLRKSNFKNNIHVLCGEIMDYGMMKLLKISEAHSVFLLNSPKMGNARQEDTSVIMTTIALKNFNQNLQVYAQINLIESKHYAMKAGAKVVVCNESFCSKVLSASSNSAGFCSFLYNLLSGADVDIDMDKIPKSLLNGDESIKMDSNKSTMSIENDIKWIVEYSEGLNCEIYRVKFSKVFVGSLFIDAARTLLKKCEIAVYALEDKQGSIFLNPSRYLIKEGDKCFCIAKSIEHAEQVQTFSQTGDKDQYISRKSSRMDYGMEKIKEDAVEIEYFESRFEEYLKNVVEQPNEELTKGQIEIMKITKQQENNIGNSQKNKKEKRQSNRYGLTYSTGGQNADIYLLSDDIETEQQEMNNYHLEILLKLISPDPCFAEKRSKLRKIRETTSEDMKEKEEKFYDSIISSYSMTRVPRPKEQFLISSFKVPFELNDHILVIGEFQQPVIICSLVRSIQKRNRNVPIVFMTHLVDKYFNSLYERLKYFSDVYFISGNPMKSHDLRRAGFTAAKSVMYFTQDTSLMNTGTDGGQEEVASFENEYTIDSEAIKLALGMAVIDPKKNYLLELVNRSNLKFFQHEGIPTYQKVRLLREKQLLDYDIDEFDQFCLFSDFYISGKIFPSSSFLSKLLAQSFHNKRVVDLVDQMVADEFSAGDSQSIIFEVPVPSVFVNLPISELVDACFEKDLILLGVSRYRYDKVYRYVYTNPVGSGKVEADDILFLCGHRKSFKKMLQKHKCNDPIYDHEWSVTQVASNVTNVFHVESIGSPLVDSPIASSPTNLLCEDREEDCQDLVSPNTIPSIEME